MTRVRVAILGAGLAGLACAIELERLGVDPVVFEKRHRVGERFLNVEIMPRALHHRPSRDIFTELRQELRLPVQPAGAVTRAVIHGPGQAASINAFIGYVTIRGHDERSLERQLERHVRTRIRFNQNPDPGRLAQEYDRVVIATGDQEVTRSLGLWQRDTAGWLRGALLLGEFSPNEVHIWLNTAYAKTGYGYLAAFDERHAYCMLAVPESNSDEVDRHWRHFLACEGGAWQVEHDTKLEKFEMGQAARHMAHPFLLVGNAGGFVEPLIGCGQCASMHSGVMAAREIVLGDGSLTRFAQEWQQYYRRVLRVRRWADARDNRAFTQLVRGLGVPGARTLLFRNPVNWIGPAGAALGSLGGPDDPQPEYRDFR